MSDTLQIIAGTEITRTIDLGDLDEAWRGATFDVWVTPTRAHLDAFTDYHEWAAENLPDLDSEEGQQALAEMGEEKSEALFAEANTRLDRWLAESWRNLPLEDVAAMREHFQDHNQAYVWTWLYRQTIGAMSDHREGLVKNSLAPSMDI